MLDDALKAQLQQYLGMLRQPIQLIASLDDSATGVEGAKAAGMIVWQFAGGCHYRNGYLQGKPGLLVDRVFDRMESFFDAAPELRC